MNGIRGPVISSNPYHKVVTDLESFTIGTKLNKTVRFQGLVQRDRAENEA